MHVDVNACTYVVYITEKFRKVERLDCIFRIIVRHVNLNFSMITDQSDTLYHRGGFRRRFLLPGACVCAVFPCCPRRMSFLGGGLALLDAVTNKMILHYSTRIMITLCILT